MRVGSPWFFIWLTSMVTAILVVCIDGQIKKNKSARIMSTLPELSQRAFPEKTSTQIWVCSKQTEENLHGDLVFALDGE